MATVYVFFVEMVVRQGLVAAIVQRAELTPTHLDTAFWMTAAAIAVLLPITVLLSGWWSNVNNTPALQPVIIGLSPVLVLRGLSVVQEAQLRRTMNFRPLAIRANVAVLAGGVVGVVAALQGADVWALVAQHLTVGVVELVVLWNLSTWRPRLEFDRGSAVDLFGFSGKSALASLGSFVNQRSDALLIGLLFGPVVVGLYRLAARLVEMVLAVAAGALQAVILPELSPYAKDPERFAERAIGLLHLGALISIPLFGVLAAISGPLMDLLGGEWVGAVDTLKVLCVFGAIQAIGLHIGPVLQASGRPGVLAWTTWLAGAVSAVSFLLAGVMFEGDQVGVQATGLAASRTITFALGFALVAMPLLKICVGVALTALARVVTPSAVAGTLSYCVVWLLFDWLSVQLGSTWDVLARALVGGLVACSVLFVLDPVARRMPNLLAVRLRGERLGGEQAVDDVEEILR